jgi:hypothetical protein
MGQKPGVIVKPDDTTASGRRAFERLCLRLGVDAKPVEFLNVVESWGSRTRKLSPNGKPLLSPDGEPLYDYANPKMAERPIAWECIGTIESLDTLTDEHPDWHYIMDAAVPRLMPAPHDHAPMPKDLSTRVTRNIRDMKYSANRLRQVEEMRRLERIPHGNVESPHHGERIALAQHKAEISIQRMFDTSTMDDAELATAFARLVKWYLTNNVEPNLSQLS